MDVLNQGQSPPLSHKGWHEIVETRSSHTSRGALQLNGVSAVGTGLKRAGSRIARLATVRSFPIQIGVVTLSVLGMTLIVKSIPPLTHYISLYLVVVLAIAVLYGAPQAVIASVISVFSYDFFAVEPIDNFVAPDPDQWLTLLLLLLVGLVTSHLAGELHRRADEAVRREHQAVAHARLTTIVAQSNDPDAILEDILRAFADDLNITGLAFLSADVEKRFELRATAGTIDHSHNWPEFWPSVTSSDSPSTAQSSTYRTFLLTTHDGPGVLVISRDGAPSPLRADQIQFLESAASQFGLAWDRIRLQARTAEVAALRQTDRLKDSFFNAISHDFRTPLAMIKVSAQSLAQKDAAWSSEEQNSFIRAIENNVDRLNVFIQNLLDLSQIEAGIVHPTCEYCSVTTIVDDILVRLEPLFAKHAVTADITECLPLVFVDPLMIDRALSNLVENAVYHTPAGTKLTIRLERRDQFVVVTVADTGPGLPPTALPYLFDRFYRVRTDRVGRPGFGLGLAVAKGMVEAHGGKIWVDVERQSGTVVSFSIPIYSPEPSGDEADRFESKCPGHEETA